MNLEAVAASDEDEAEEEEGGELLVDEEEEAVVVLVGVRISLPFLSPSIHLYTSHPSDKLTFVPSLTLFRWRIW